MRMVSKVDHFSEAVLYIYFYLPLSLLPPLYPLEVAAWSWSNVDYTHFIVVTSIGFVLVLVGSSHSLSLWGKLPLISRYCD